MRSIKVTVTKQGKVTLEAFGYEGTSCLQATAAIERAIGKTEFSMPKTEEPLAAETTVEQS